MTETFGDWEQPPGNPTRPSDDVARRDALRRDLQRHYAEVARLENALDGMSELLRPPIRVVVSDHLLAGVVIGFAGAAGSLLVHILGALLIGMYPLRIIQAYLTFPMGDQALYLESGPPLALGTLLYLAAGAAFGVVFHFVLSGLFAEAPAFWRLLVASSMGLLLWIVNFYLILSWLQPLVTGGPAVTRYIPAWLAAVTHLVFAWTILLAETPTRAATEPAA